MQGDGLVALDLKSVETASNVDLRGGTIYIYIYFFLFAWLEIATRLSAQRLSVCKLYANSRALPFHVALLHAAHCRASLQVGLQSDTRSDNEGCSPSSALRTNRL